MRAKRSTVYVGNIIIILPDPSTTAKLTVSPNPKSFIDIPTIVRRGRTFLFDSKEKITGKVVI